MKKKLIFPVATCLMLFGASASAVTITEGAFNGTDVGGLDNFLAETSLPNSGESTETAWARLITGDTALNLSGKVETVGIFSTDAVNTFAFQLVDPYPGYFLVKNSTHWALFENNADYEWGVFSTDGLLAGFNVTNSTTTISHYSGFGSVPTVPDGGTTSALLGFALLGLSGARRFLVGKK